MDEIRRCTKCIMPETFPGITFNEEGVCNLCTSYEPFPVLGEDKLRELLNSQKGGEYDAVVAFSGGKDSAYVLYYAVKVLNLKVIAVSYDAGFTSDQAKENMENACRILNVPLVVKTVEFNNQVKMVKETLRIAEITGVFSGVCGNCETNVRFAAIQIAQQYNVPFILYGSSRSESAGVPSFISWGTVIKRVSTPRNIKDMFRLWYHLGKYYYYNIRQGMELGYRPFRMRFWPKPRVPFPKGIRAIRFYDYIEWDTLNKLSLLEKELGWKTKNGKKHRFNCSLRCFGNYTWFQQSGITTDGFNFSTWIRGNNMSREEALASEIGSREKREAECMDVIERVGLKNYKMPKNKLQ